MQYEEKAKLCGKTQKSTNHFTKLSYKLQLYEMMKWWSYELEKIKKIQTLKIQASQTLRFHHGWLTCSTFNHQMFHFKNRGPFQSAKPCPWPFGTIDWTLASHTFLMNFGKFSRNFLKIEWSCVFLQTSFSIRELKM